VAARLMRKTFGGSPSKSCHPEQLLKVLQLGEALTDSGVKRDVMTTIQQLMEQFGALKGARVGFGHKHPLLPNHIIAEDVATFLSKFPFLQSYSDYVEFLECYAGAGIYRPTERDVSELYLDIFGFTPVSSHMYEEMDDGGLVDDQGFFIFCMGMINSDTYPHFALSATSKHPNGIYHTINNTGEPRSDVPHFAWLCTTFSDFLVLVINNDGVLV
jgi:hypothetical protein